jgi:hypothetical protein
MATAIWISQSRTTWTAAVSVLRGDRTGRLSSPPVACDGGNTPFWVVAPDLSGDGAPDLVTVDGYLYPSS